MAETAQPMPGPLPHDLLADGLPAPGLGLSTGEGARTSVDRAAQVIVQPLPRQVKPFPRETIASYLRRLAHANGLDQEPVRRYITAGRRGWAVPVGRLSAATGLPEATLRYAIANLDGSRGQHTVYLDGVPVLRGETGLPCHLCVAVAGITGPVWCWKHPERVVCLRHQRWTGLTACTAQLSLARQPQILQAHTRHLRLVRRFGRDEVAFAFAAADAICRRWHDQREHDAGFRHRMAVFHGPGWAVPPGSPTVAAAVYPQAIALTRLLASPFWQSLVADDIGGGQDRFFAEVRRTVALGYAWPRPFRSTDPLYRWLFEHRFSRRPRLPVVVR
jgi:hypothetical protein